MLTQTIYYSILFFIQAGAGNAAATTSLPLSKNKILKRLHRPLDFNKKFLNKPIFGNHKTILGTILYFLTVIILGAIETAITADTLFLYFSPAIAFLAISGDLTGSFIKRRLNLKPGQDICFFSRIDFVIYVPIFLFLMNVNPFQDPLLSILTLYAIFFILAYPLHNVTEYIDEKFLKIKQRRK